MERKQIPKPNSKEDFPFLHALIVASEKTGHANYLEREGICHMLLGEQSGSELGGGAERV